MGMFNFVTCDLPLPEYGLDEWQSKDFHALALDYYRINADGELILERNGYGEILNFPMVDYVGRLHFYGMDADHEWIEYRAKVVDGRCLEIQQLEDQRADKWVWTTVWPKVAA